MKEEKKLTVVPGNNEEEKTQQLVSQKQLEILNAEELKSLNLLDDSAKQLYELMSSQAKKENPKPYDVETTVKVAQELRSTLKLKLDVIKFVLDKK